MSYIVSIFTICFCAAALPFACTAFLRSLDELRLDRQRRAINRYRR